MSKEGIKTYKKWVAGAVAALSLAAAIKFTLRPRQTAGKVNVESADQAAKPAVPTKPAIEIPRPELQRPVQVGKFGDMEKVWGRTMWIRPNNNGVIYELKGARKKNAIVKVEFKSDGTTAYHVSGKEEPVIVNPEIGKAVGWSDIVGFDVVEQRVQPTKEDITYYITDNATNKVILR